MSPAREHTMNADQQDWDVVVIGSGAGGLTAAVALSNIGKRVLVLEQHYLPGGWTHSFSLQGHRFSPGVHYIGQLGPGGRTREILEGIGVGGTIEFNELNPEGYDHIVFADETFDIPRGKDRFIDRLVSRFPSEQQGIKRYFQLVERVNRGLDSVMECHGFRGMLTLLAQAPALILHGFRSATSVIRRHIRDPKLQAILEARSGDHGVSPAKVPFALHAAIEAHYWEGAWYPCGGGGAIPRALIGRLRANGGEIKTRTRVQRILLEHTSRSTRATGVELDDGRQIMASHILSNADAWVTYDQLVGRQHLSRRLGRKMESLRPSVSALSLFVATDLDIEALGLDSGNYWVLHDEQVATIYSFAESDDLSGDSKFSGAFVTITTMKDPDKKKDGVHTLEAFTFVPEFPFREWRDSTTGDRPESYARFKQQLTDRMLHTIESLLPGLRDHLIVCELGSPLTNEHYVAACHGNIYGPAKTWRQVGPFALPITTEIDGLFHCGQSTTAHGVLGVMMTGVQAACAISGRNESELLQFHSEGGMLKINPQVSGRAERMARGLNGLLI
jgi:all-trans-retinol 13,14-reductase